MRALVSADALLAELRDDKVPVVLVDVQWSLTATAGPPGRELYAAAHLPGAHHVDLDAELAGPPGAGGRHPLPQAHAVEAAARRCGADNDSRIVVYDQGPSMGAARGWWVLRYFGATDVRVLDGGLAAWRSVGGPVTTEPPEPGAGAFEAHAGGMPLVDAEGAARVAREGLLLDARAAERFRGETEPIDPVAGHVPGAVSAPTTENLAADDCFLDAATLRDLFSRKGDLTAGPVAAYCGSGVTAAHEVLALHEAGIEAALYAGSWSEWITDPSRPVATGA
ncbi:thiosulfate/3-mercaptopyruvate sulfurtransferase [Pedococcus dokdonensis]|uniref:Sulfurtransferase n=1 Tax=Pedococcus dokdonensis TaxID=443156 RepID=A0A1H0Q0B5_9MICO|nr:sulfurtransferase [Pedococcus dokdonensis]SDP10832.1 thiosulfate/3-mercaptopyruvate sulfurtransferase [Pedococcus dokdonensis]